MSMLSADQASFAVRWETMDTMVCSIFSGAKSVCASVDLLRGPLSPDIGAVSCSLMAEMSVSEAAAVVAAVGSVETGLAVMVAVRSAETMAGAGVRAPSANLLPGKRRGMSVRKDSQVSEAEPGFLEIGDASYGLMRGAA